jgi:sporulation protein YhbH
MKPEDYSKVFTMSGIKRDHGRFKDIVSGKIRQNLKKFISNGELIGKKGDEFVSIPIPSIELPRFVFGKNQGSKMGQGKGNPGDPVEGEEQEGGDPKEAGNQEGKHELEVDVSLQELAEMLGQELGLPRILPKGSHDIDSKSARYKSIHHVGPHSLRHYKRTYREALKRQIAAGIYNPENPVIIPHKSDLRFRGWAETPRPQTNAVIVYIMDVSGSMGDEQKEIVRTEAFWIDTWLQSQYKGLQRRYIIHDAVAREVDENTFYRTRESGGTLISSAYKMFLDIIHRDYPPQQWNIYPFHFSDGDNWSNEDSQLCLDLLKNEIFPIVNQFSYGQVESKYGSGQFFKDLLEKFSEEERLVACRVQNREGIYESIKQFFTTGR